MRRPRLTRHPVRWVSRLIALQWAWRNRHDLLRWARFAMRLPTEVRSRDLDSLVTEARARIALSADPRTRLAPHVDIVGFDHGSLIVRAPHEAPIALLAQEELSKVAGVTDVQVVDEARPIAPPADSAEHQETYSTSTSAGGNSR